MHRKKEVPSYTSVYVDTEKNATAWGIPAGEPPHCENCQAV